MEQNGTSYTMLLGPIGRDRRDSIRFSITETELTILESALGDGHGGGAYFCGRKRSSKTPRPLFPWPAIETGRRP